MARYAQLWIDLNPNGDEDTPDWPVLQFDPGEENDYGNMMKCVAIYRDEKGILKKDDLARIEAWYGWLSESTTPPGTPTSERLNLLLCPKKQLSTAEYPWDEPAAELTTIPLTRVVLKKVAENFHIRPRYFQSLERQRIHLSTPAPNEGSVTYDSPSSSTLGKPATYSALFKSDIENYPGNIALLYSYSPKPKASYGIFFGCSKRDIEEIYGMLKMAGPASAHPLLLPAIFAELQTSRLHELGGALMDKAVTVNNEVDKLRSGQKHFLPPNLTKSVGDINTAAKILEEDIATAHRHLKKLISSIKPRDPSSTAPENYDDKFRQRFEQMSGEYDDLSGSCRVNIGKAILNAETHTIVISKHAAKASVVLAFVAMIYLPISAVSSIFAMPILDFKADWRDIYGRSAPTEPGSDDSQPVIVSYYLAHYLGVSIALLLLTLEGWHISTREDKFKWRQFWKFLLTTRLLLGAWEVLARGYRLTWKELKEQRRNHDLIVWVLQVTLWVLNWFYGEVKGQSRKLVSNTREALRRLYSGKTTETRDTSASSLA